MAKRRSRRPVAARSTAVAGIAPDGESSIESPEEAVEASVASSLAGSPTEPGGQGPLARRSELPSLAASQRAGRATGTQPLPARYAGAELVPSLPPLMARSSVVRSIAPAGLAVPLPPRRMPTSHLARIAYASATTAELPRRQLDALLSTWRRDNASRGITGFVLHHRASVFQVLEGFPDVIAALYETIARDPRHRFVAKLIDEPIDERGFGDWSMGHARLASLELGAVGPLTPFLDPAFRYWHCNEAMARELIDGFVTGSWRRSIV